MHHIEYVVSEIDRRFCFLDLGVKLSSRMSHQVVKVRRDAVAPCMTCPLCRKLFRDATTISECLHTFCRKCIYKKLSEEEMECCPICSIDLGCVPLEKLRPDHTLQDVRAKIFPSKRIKAKTPEVVPPVTLPAKRKERSLSSLVVSTPRVSTQSGMTGRRSKSTARKASRGSSFTIEKPVKKEDESMEGHPESSSSPDMLNKLSQSTRQNSASGEPYNQQSANKGMENGSEAWEGKLDLWKPLNCLVEAANRSKSSKINIQGSAPKSETLQHNDGLLASKTKNKEQRQKSKVQDDRACNDQFPSESERQKKLRKFRQKKAQNYGEFRAPPQFVLDASSIKLDRRNYPIWFSLVPEEQEGDGPTLPQIAASYIRIKDGSAPVSFIKKYLKMKLNLSNEDEIEIKCMGQPVIPTLMLSNLVDLWLQNPTRRISATVGSSAKDFVMVLSYARKTS
ncbi:E3 ubiquitin protein ligase DRIP2 [Andrographis paniculata]|uniref:E3 ubiquitin protein ligase DRIP2 n=1 Tax=Andrographis paniculata TaxID=175694 RepID=UPI0021E8D503|nr:E3 ubiquitin protein ligase DRIP2 [Andrographis paniculata]XP_051142264.1 E3 ubiquitin protein ligase DRIP2 [Andrographis paniculata]